MTIPFEKFISDNTFVCEGRPYVPVSALRTWFDKWVEGQRGTQQELQVRIARLLYQDGDEGQPEFYNFDQAFPWIKEYWMQKAGYAMKALAPPQPAGEAELRECNKCGGRDLGVVWHKGHANSVFSWENSGCNASVDHKGIDPYTEHLYKFCRTCQYSWREALAATAKEGGG